MILADFHTHTNYCDGKNTPEEMVLGAIERGMEAIGFTEHSYTPFDLRYCLTEEKTEQYIRDVRSLQQKYGNRIKIYCGLELDSYAPIPEAGTFDFYIGSVHYVKFGEDYVVMDEGNDNLRRGAELHCDGDVYAIAEAYFERVVEAVRRCDAAIIGHFDVISKFQELDPIFDENHPRYKAAWRKALDTLIPMNKVFEVNVGAISRGKRTTPYPSRPILQEIAARGGNLMLTGDTHQKENLCFQFEHWAEEIGKMGIKLKDYTVMF